MQFPNIMKQHLVALLGGGIFYNANRWLPCLCKLLIHTSHFEFWSRESVMFSVAAHQLWTNKTQCQHIFSISQQLNASILTWVITFILPECHGEAPLSVSFIQKRVTGFKEIQCSFDWAEKSWSRYVLPEHSNTIPLQNHYMDFESSIHTHAKER
jgi:hypothetical protein